MKRLRPEPERTAPGAWQVSRQGARLAMAREDDRTEKAVSVPVRHFLNAIDFERAMGTERKSGCVNPRGRDAAIPQPVTAPDDSFFRAPRIQTAPARPLAVKTLQAPLRGAEDDLRKESARLGADRAIGRCRRRRGLWIHQSGRPMGVGCSCGRRGSGADRGFRVLSGLRPGGPPHGQAGPHRPAAHAKSFPNGCTAQARLRGATRMSAMFCTSRTSCMPRRTSSSGL